MPRGVFPRKPKAQKMQAMMNVDSAPVRVETDEEVEAKLADRFEVLESMTQLAIDGEVRSLVVSGPAGLGKSWTVEKALETWDPSEQDHTVIRGYVRPTGLFKLLYQHRARGQVVVFDDADSIFYDDTSINLLKAACDTTDRRRISYISEAVLVDEETAERLPKSFDFEGTVIFITNCDFDSMIDRGHKLAPHLAAIVSRSHYVDLAMRTKRDYIVRIRQVIKQGLLADRGLSDTEQHEVAQYVEDNQDKLRELSLRMALKVASIRRKGGNWQKVARVTCMKAA